LSRLALALPLAVAAGALLAVPGAFADAPRDSTRLGVEWGLSSDYTNQIYYEETFDSTAVTGRVRGRKRGDHRAIQSSSPGGLNPGRRARSLRMGRGSGDAVRRSTSAGRRGRQKFRVSETGAAT